MEPYRPAVWTDDTRMNVLFSPFRERNLNPSSWTQKMKFWIQVIEDDFKLSNKCIFERKSLPLAFARKGKQPNCLDTVIAEMLSLGKIRKLQENDILQSSSECNGKGWLTWGYDTLLKSPIAWGWSTLTKDKTTEDNTRYILEDSLKNVCTSLLQRHQCQAYCDIVSNIMEYSALYSQYGDLCSSELEFKVVIQQLVKTKKVAISTKVDTVVVKFCSHDNEQVKEITEEDLQILRIKKTSSTLTDKVEKLSAVGERLKKEAIQYRNQSMRQHALRTFREYKRIQGRISKLSNSIDLLDDILHKISHAASEEMIVKAIESGAQTLKSINERNDLDKVTDVMEDLNQAIQDQEDIQTEMSMFGNEDDESLDASLENLLKEGHSAAVGDHPDVKGTTDDKGDKRSSTDELADLLLGLKLPDVPNLSPEKTLNSAEKDLYEDVFVPDISVSGAKMSEKTKKKEAEHA